MISCGGSKLQWEESKSSQRPFASDSTTLVFTSYNHSLFDSYQLKKEENYQKQKYKKSCKLRQSFTLSLTISASNMSFFIEHNPLKKLHCKFFDCFNAMRFNFHVCNKKTDVWVEGSVNTLSYKRLKTNLWIEENIAQKHLTNFFYIAWIKVQIWRRQQL